MISYFIGGLFSGVLIGIGIMCVLQVTKGGVTGNKTFFKPLIQLTLRKET